MIAATLLMLAAAQAADAAPPPYAMPGEEIVDPYVPSADNVGAGPFKGTGMVDAFHGQDGIRRIVESFVERNFADPVIGYVCGQLRLEGEGGENQEGLYWRYETAARALESRLAGVTAGNGAINAVRREAYIALEPTRLEAVA